ncbi:MFS transporter [Dasania sp. GY-MA-18]|uniref:MFS transporter n=1 Tax=Dasania phycosphaerae TaxID=2950436 RepID=A0A9J6RM56_9GAMM|nr:MULTISPECIES: MFS transporter [Dasania]MCR8923171.1 MFS transporter [Dasania sp. GY-MA-18]MCZ0865603.1 MFS transporter [Dasania phycosphaerae]MCZ0869328.1 MFS transporter [Dasania phycosphaerae]
MSTEALAIKSPLVIAAVVFMTVVSAAGFLLLPLLVGTVSSALSFNDKELGYLSSFVLLASAISSVGAVFWVRKINWRLAGAVSFGFMILGHSVAIFSEQAMLTVLALALASFGGGSAYSLMLTVLSDSSQPDRNFGFSIAAQVAFQVLGLALLPGLIAQTGLLGLLTVLLLLDFVAMLAVLLLPGAGKTVSQLIKLSSIMQPGSLLALMGCFFFFFNVGCYWTYIERMGAASGLAASFMGWGLSIGVAVGIAGALLAAWKGERYGRGIPLAIGAVGTVIAVLMLAGVITEALFIASAALYNFVWNYSLAYQYAAVNAVDRSGCSVAVAPAFHSMGAALGPGLAALLMVQGDFSAVLWLITVSVLLSLCCFVMAFALGKKTLAVI